MRTRIANSTAPIFRRAPLGFLRSSPWICSSCQAHSSRIRYRSTQSASEKPYYITTPIFYVNAAPHVGHLYTMVLADIMKRWQVLKGKQAILLTGTDEHGLKVQRAAAKAGVDPKLFCDKGADIFKVCPCLKLRNQKLTTERNLHGKLRSPTTTLCEQRMQITKIPSSTHGYANVNPVQNFCGLIFGSIYYNKKVLFTKRSTKAGILSQMNVFTHSQLCSHTSIRQQGER